MSRFDLCRYCGGSGEVLTLSNDSGYCVDGGLEMCGFCAGTGNEFTQIIRPKDSRNHQAIGKAIEQIEAQFKRKTT